MKKYITVGELAIKYNKTYTQAWYAVKTGKISSVRIGWQYLIPIKSLPSKWPIKEV